MVVIRRNNDCALRGVNAQFSQSKEKELADYGLTLLKRHGYDQNATVTALRKLADGGPRGFSRVAPHPAPHDQAAPS